MQKKKISFVSSEQFSSKLKSAGSFSAGGASLSSVPNVCSNATLVARALTRELASAIFPYSAQGQQ